ncbi:hypothetical protein DRO41_00080 [Candidatus Bathyarchaeota archaeon]|nr:MAG: hypothetical protein DRO41_00080 [Candidatus Bathyarchaeota archaeon]
MIDEKTLKQLYKKLRGKRGFVGFSRVEQPVLAEGVETGETGIRVYVRKKLPVNLLREQDIIPSEFKGKRVDVVEVGDVKALKVDKTKEFRPVEIGVSVGHINITACSLGFYPIYKDGVVLVGGNAHCYTPDASLSPEQIREKRIVQPGRYHDKNSGIVGEYFWHERVVPVDEGCPIGKAVVSVLNFLAKLVGSGTRLTLERDNVNHIDFAVYVPTVEHINKIADDSIDESAPMVGFLFAGSDQVGVICKARYIVEKGFTFNVPVAEVHNGDRVKGCSFWCMPPDTLVMGNPTPTTIANVTSVLEAGGEFSKVLTHFSRDYEGDLCDLTVKGYRVSLTPEHPVLTARPSNKYHKQQAKALLKWKPAGEVTTDDYVAIPKIKTRNHTKEYHLVRTKFSQKRVPPVLEVNEDLAWIIGLYIAEGSCSPQGLIRWTLGEHETHLIQKLKQKLASVFGLRIKEYKGTGTRYIDIYCSDLIEMFKQCGKNAHEKVIPSFILRGPKEVWRSCIQGIQDGDGCELKAWNKISTTSKKLMFQLMILCASLGYGFTTTSFFNGGFGRSIMMHQISIRTTKKRDSGFEDENFLYLPIKKATTRFYKGKVYNVETPGNTYCVPFVVHNCNYETTVTDESASIQVNYGNFTALFNDVILIRNENNTIKGGWSGSGWRKVT